jgi:aspartyl protease family protein
MRALLVMIFAIGVMGALATHLGSPRAPSPQPIVANTAESGSQATVADAPKLESVLSTDGALDIARSPDGHFYADVDVNGSKLHMLVDTGATEVALSREDARSAGIATSIGMPNVIGEGADGSVHGEVATADRISLGNAKAQSMPVVVLNSGAQSLLGQSFLAKFASVEIHGDTMTLR